MDPARIYRVLPGSSRTARDRRRAECGGEGGTIGKEDPEEGVEEGETGELGVLHSAVVALSWAAQYCSGYNAGTRELRQAMESVAVVCICSLGLGFAAQVLYEVAPCTVPWTLYHRAWHLLPWQHWEQGSPLLCSASFLPYAWPPLLCLGPGPSSCPPTNQARGGRNRRVGQGQSDLQLFHLISKIGPPITCL